MLRSIYVDDIVAGSHSENEAYKLYTGAKMLLKSGAFNLRKFLSNSGSLQTKIDEEESSIRSNTAELNDSTETFTQATQATLGRTQVLHDSEHKVLGVTWNVSSDQIVFSLTELAEQAKNLEPTKRNVISLIGRFYDPLGFLAPIVVRYKIFMQALCEAKISWDEAIPVAKTRVIPLKKQSIPRLELLSAVLLARLMDAVRSSLTPELEISSHHCFTDSKIALYWICNVEKAWKPFVQNSL